MSNDELFDCFGSDDDDDDDDVHHGNHNNNEAGNDSSSPQQKHNSKQSQGRDPNCGVCSQLNAERSLLVHVKNNVDPFTKRSNESSNTSIDGEDQDILSIRTENVQKIIDEFCNKRAWMMHIGPEKAMIIQETLKAKIDDFIHENSTVNNSTASTTSNEAKFVCVELGTYCGYGSSVLCKTLHEYAMKYDLIDFHLFTVEINPVYSQIAQEIIDLCGMNKYVTILENELLLSGDTGDVGLLLKEGIKEYYSTNNDSQYRIDFLLIDHDKDAYLSDLKLLERHDLIKEGTAVAADNVVFAGISDYVSYMKDLADAGIVNTTTVESMVEYSEADILNDEDELFKDGIGE